MHLTSNLMEKISDLSRKQRMLILIFIDVILFWCAIYSSFLLVEQHPFNSEIISYDWIFPAILIIGIPFYIFEGEYQGLTKYLGSQALYKIALSNFKVLFILFNLGILLGFYNYSINLWIIFWILTTISNGGVRFLLRDILLFSLSNKNTNTRVVAIYGAGLAGAQLAASLTLAKSHQIKVFIDDAPHLWNRTLNDIPIKSPDYLNRLKGQIDQVLLAIPSLQRNRRKVILENIQKKGIPILEVPSVEDITSGNAQINDLRVIHIEELLGRRPVDPDQTLLLTGISGKVVLVTGAGGSIGSEICRQIISLRPMKLILLEFHEPSLYSIGEELKGFNQDNINILSILGSSTDRVLIENIFNEEYVEIVFHAAAYKHVPIVEYNPIAGVQNNILSTKVICSSARNCGVEKVVLVSTDKAVRPTNVMGASKRLAEIIVQEFAKETKTKKINLTNEKVNTCFTMVRFGNVLNSSGSVVPLFRKQIASGGPITLTHAKINRYFMTLKEAAQLVIQVAVLSQGGEVFLLDMGKPIKIRDLAERMILLSGLTFKDENSKEGDIEIIETGLRPGEKICEELLIDPSSQRTSHPLIYKANEVSSENPNFWSKLNELEEQLIQRDIKKTLALLLELVPEWEMGATHKI